MKLHLAERANVVPRLNTLGVACLFWLFSPVSAALAQYHVDSWTTDNGLPQNVIRDACQTPDGYLWLATMDGLVRFDGVRFTVFNRSNTPGIHGNRYTSLYCTRGGEIWAGTEMSGVTRYRGGTFSTYNTQQGLPSDSAPAVTCDDTGRVWALSQGSIVQWDEAGSRFMDLPPERSRYSYSPNGRFGFWSLDRDNVHLFVRGQVLNYPLPREWPRHLDQGWPGFKWSYLARIRRRPICETQWRPLVEDIPARRQTNWLEPLHLDLSRCSRQSLDFWNRIRRWNLLCPVLEPAIARPASENRVQLPPRGP